MSMTLGRTLWVWCWAATTSGQSVFQQFAAENSLHRALFCFHRHMLCRHQLIIDTLWKHGECDRVYFHSCSTHWVCVYILYILSMWWWAGCLLSFRVIDLGVMVPCDKILREAMTHKAGMIEWWQRIRIFKKQQTTKPSLSLARLLITERCKAWNSVCLVSMIEVLPSKCFEQNS